VSGYPLAAALEVGAAALDEACAALAEAQATLWAHEAQRDAQAAEVMAAERERDARVGDARRMQAEAHRPGDAAGAEGQRHAAARAWTRARASREATTRVCEEAAQAVAVAAARVAEARIELRALEKHREAWERDRRRRAAQRAEDEAEEARAGRPSSRPGA